MWTGWPYIGLSLVALAVGSFLGLVVVRFGLAGFTQSRRSRCHDCRHTLSWLDLMPLLSWFVLRGRCRYCGSSIGKLYPVIEAGALIVGVAAAVLFGGTQLAAALFLGWTLLLLAGLDWRYFTLPLPLTVGLATFGIAAARMTIVGDEQTASLGWVVGFLSFEAVRRLYCRLRGRPGMGQGDVWLFAASGAWVGWQNLPWVLLLSAVLALAGSYVMLRGRHWHGSAKLPFGSWLAAGTWIVYCTTVSISLPT